MKPVLAVVPVSHVRGEAGVGAVDKGETLRQVVEALGSVVKVPGPVTMETHILHDLNLDSVAVMDVVMVLETRFDTVIPMDRLAEIETVGDLVRLLSRADTAAAGGGR